MSGEAVKQAADGSLNEAPDGSVVEYGDVTTTEDCCCDLFPVECLNDPRAIRTLRSRGGPLLPSNGLSYDEDGAYTLGWEPTRSKQPWANNPGCTRLYVWERRTVTGNVYGGAPAPDFILKTTRYAQRHSPLGASSGPFETSPGSGTLLDDEPYWWSTCHVGGYEDVGSMWFAITAATIDASRTLSLADGTYTMLAMVRFRHATKNVGVDGGAILVPMTDGGVSLTWVKHIRYA